MRRRLTSERAFWRGLNRALRKLLKHAPKTVRRKSRKPKR